ncbi:MAG: YVTN family beta-propeller protein [Planctomycetota bacterium]|jgi:YVTN family beta-propeller protein
MKCTPIASFVMTLILALGGAAQQVTTLTPAIVSPTKAGLASRNPLMPSGAVLDVPVSTFDDSMIQRDNVAGTYILQEVGHLRPVMNTNGVIIAVNQEGGNLVVFGTNPLKKIVEIPIGLGANSVYAHPFRPLEIWITDSISNCVTVIDPNTLAVGQTIRTNGAPHGLVFSDSGDRAYVTCSSGRTVDVIDTFAFQVVNSIDVPARRPRGIAKVGNNIHIAPLISGNNTTALGAGGSGFRFVLDIPPFASMGANPLADVDLRTIGVSSTGLTFETLIPGLEWTQLGTTILNVQNRPGSNELWICNTDALNAAVIGEQNFVDGQVVLNQVTIVDVAGGPGAAPIFVDLDQVSGGIGCSQPRGVAFDSARSQVYVMCEGSDRVCVLGAAGNWLGSWKLSGQNGIRCLPQGATLLGDDLYVWNKGTNSLTQINVVTTPLNTVVSNHTSLGHTPLTDKVRRGRGIINNADISAGGSSSCASCHIDGDLDGVVWDLSSVLDPEGTPNNQLQFFTDRKGAMVTQSLNGLPEGAPYHWRGERKDLEAFNAAFEGLLDGAALMAAELSDMVAYINELHYPANHVQQDNRETTPSELEGARVFVEELATAGSSCADCHSMPYGSNNEVMREAFAAFAPSTKVTQLRNVADKVLGQHDLGILTWPSGASIDLGDATEFGPGLTHDGRIATLFDFSNTFANIDPTESARLEDFMRAFDTGLAPATAIQATMTQANALTMPELALLIDEAIEGDCDLVASGSVSTGGAPPLRVTAYFDPMTGLFQFEAKSFGNVPPLFLSFFVNAGYGSWTFRGVPVGTGRRIIDRDLDGLGNLDEKMYNTDPENGDSDGDGYPDGYEIKWSMDPNVVDTSSPDGQAPGIVSSTPLYALTNTVKLNVVTDELCVVTATWTGLRGVETRVSSKFAPYAMGHQFVINFLPENTSTPVTLMATDPSGLSSTMVVNAMTDAEIVSDIHIDAINLSTGPIAVQIGTSLVKTQLTAVVDVKDHLGAPAVAGYEGSAFVYLETSPGNLLIIDVGATATTNAAGKMTFNVPITWTLSSTGGPRSIYLGVVDIVPTPGSGLLSAYTEANDIVNFTSITF